MDATLSLELLNGRPHVTPRERFDNTPEVEHFARALERTCIETVEAGHMTKDLATLIGPAQPWLTTNAFMAKLAEGLRKEVGS